MSKSWQYQNVSKAISFRRFLNDISSDIIEIPAGAFKESGTNIATVIVVASKKSTTSLFDQGFYQHLN